MVDELKLEIVLLYALTPNDGAYYNEVILRPARVPKLAPRHPCSSSIGKRRCSDLIIRLSRVSRTSMIHLRFPSLRRALGPMTGTSR
jgi:hypothetical protein